MKFLKHDFLYFMIQSGLNTNECCLTYPLFAC